ncbi:MAG TPA: SDR family oxidoreductase [Candidatus Binatia bacterium]|nr:SDR family oxidoreductase [Candidatus Binatia bacterium]
MELAWQAAVVTGGGSGIGRGVALGIARAGANVLVADVRGSEAESVVRTIRAAGGNAEAFAADLSREDTARAMIAACVDKFGRIDILVNNAGLRMERHDDDVYESWRCLQMRGTDELAVADWDLVLGVNLRAVFLCTHFALPHMIRQRHGTILSLSSNAGSQGVAGKSAYVASKHAVEGLMKTVAAEMREHGISANAIHPGGRVDVDGRGGHSPEIVVPLALSLCRQDEPIITGQTIKASEWNEKNVPAAATPHA